MMDENKLKMLKPADESRNNSHQFLRKTMQFLVSISFLSLAISYTSGFSFFVYFNFQFSTLLFSVFTHTFERKYMFIICNGIVAFLGKNLNLFISSPPPPDVVSDTNVKFFKTNEDGGNIKSFPGEPSEREGSLTIKYTAGNILVTEARREEQLPAQEHSNVFLDEELEGNERGALMMVESEEQEEDEKLVEAEETQTMIGAVRGEEGNEVNISTEELNKKFEEFIRKMKKEIRIEAQQQLIAV